MEHRIAGAAETGTASGDVDGARVLVVDDDAAIRGVFLLALRHAGYEALEASSGDEALELLSRVTVDLTLLDMEMPGLSGIELANRLRADPRHESMAMIFVSGDGALSSKLAGLEAGANDYLVKPVALEELLARVAAQVRDRTLWLARLDQELASRSRMARRISTLDPAIPLAVLERELHAVFSAELPHLLEMSIDPPGEGDGELTIVATDGITHLRVPLRFAGMLVGVVDAQVAGPPNRAVSTLSDLSLQLGAVVADGVGRRGATLETRAWVDGLVQDGGMSPVYQPIVSLADMSIIGYEGLTRFTDGTRPDIAFARASDAGVSAELEIAAICRLLGESTSLQPGCWLSLNISAGTLLRGTVDDLLAGADRDVVLEVTENEHVEDYTAVRDRLAGLPGVRLAVDDAGAGYASLRHIFELRPDFIKLDRSWIAAIDQDPVRQALVHGLIGFSGAFGARIVAEGVERDEECTTLQALGVPLAQGFLFGRPSAAP